MSCGIFWYFVDFSNVIFFNNSNLWFISPSKSDISHVSQRNPHHLKSIGKHPDSTIPSMRRACFHSDWNSIPTNKKNSLAWPGWCHMCNTHSWTIVQKPFNCGGSFSSFTIKSVPLSFLGENERWVLYCQAKEKLSASGDWLRNVERKWSEKETIACPMSYDREELPPGVSWLGKVGKLLVVMLQKGTSSKFICNF